jgi:cyclopropane fatty-acyl-phospholipid synthase-like methyltransferase
MNGGYDAGYRVCNCFWGTDPGSVVKALADYVSSWAGLRVLDVGCGEGKNAAFLSAKGAIVDAIEVSEIAVRNGRRCFPDRRINWQIGDVRTVRLEKGEYDVVIAYGLFHCFKTRQEISSVIIRLQEATVLNGFHVVCAFNDRHQELVAHEGFSPCLLHHQEYLEAYSSWKLIVASDSDLTEIHPHNRIQHTHTLTRILAQKRLRE